MTERLHITSRTNERVKSLVRLRNRRQRDEAGLTIIEEETVIRRSLEAGYPRTEVWYCPQRESPAIRALRDELLSGAAVAIEADGPVMDKVSYRDESDGLLVVAPQVRRRLDELELPADRPPLLVILEAVEKPGNLGAVQRIADGAGCQAVIVCDGGTDLFNPNVLRASRGACFAIPTVAAGGNAVRSWLDARGVRTLATSPMATATWDMADFTGPVAIVLGTEHQGLTQDWLDTTDENIAIPMAGIGDSLNVAATAAVLLFEAVRQRRAPQEAE
ncbi:RNA methyltransferase [bacterium]|nr:MAG: RNA methyltransferase [bacterium]